MNLSSYLARRFMLNPKQRALRSAIWVIALSVAPLVFVSQLSRSMVEGIIDRFLETYSYHLQVTSFLDPTFIEAKERLADAPMVRAVYEEVRSYGLAFSPTGRMSVQLRGIDPKLYMEDTQFRRYLTIEPSEATLNEGEVWMGVASAKQLGLGVGDTVRLMVVYEDGMGVYQPRILRAEITALVSTGYQNLDESWLFLTLPWASELLAGGEREHLFGIKVHEPHKNIKATRDAVQAILENNYLVYDWQNLNKSELVSLNSSRGILLFLLILITVVAIANTVGVLQLFYLEQIRSIVTLTFLGMHRRQLFAFYLFASFWTALAGVLLGAFFGLLLTFGFVHLLPWVEDVSVVMARGLGQIVPWIEWPVLDLSFYLRGMDVRIEWLSLLMSLSGVIILTVILSLVPAWQASVKKPMQLLRKV